MTTSPRALSFILLFILFWSLEILATKIAFLAGAKILPFAVQSSISALLILSVWVIPRERVQLASLLTKRRKLLFQIVTANAVHYAIGSLLYCFGISFTKAINVAFLVTLCTPMSSILAKYILDEPISRRRAFLLCTIAGGAYILTTNLQAIVPHVGDLFIIAAAFFWSLGNVLMRRALRDSDISGEVVSLLKPVVGLPLFLLATLFANFYPHPVSDIFSTPLFQPDYAGYAAVSGIFAALLWIFLYRSLKIAESAYVSMLGMATPVFVTIMAAVFLDERMTMIQAGGAMIILFSGIMTHRLQMVAGQVR